MKHLLVPLFGLAAFGAQAQQEVGNVLSSTPVIQQVAVPRQVCNAQPVAQPSSSGGGALVGAVVGGLLGNTIGHGMGRAAATGVGVVAGAAVGDRIESQGQGPQMTQQCYTQNQYENRTVGYDVRYEYAGREYTVRLPYDPGTTVRLQVTPVGAGGDLPPVAGQPGVPVMAPPMPAYPQAPAPVVQYQPMPAPVVVPPPVVYPSYGYTYPPRYYYGPPPVSLHLGVVRHWR